MCFSALETFFVKRVWTKNLTLTRHVFISIFKISEWLGVKKNSFKENLKATRLRYFRDFLETWFKLFLVNIIWNNSLSSDVTFAFRHEGKVQLGKVNWSILPGFQCNIALVLSKQCLSKVNTALSFFKTKICCKKIRRHIYHVQFSQFKKVSKLTFTIATSDWTKLLCLGKEEKLKVDKIHIKES